MADFHKVPFVILAAVVTVTAGSLTYFFAVYREPLGPEYGWGGNSTLSVNLNLTEDEVDINDSLHFNIILKNTGPESIRVYIDSGRPELKMYQRVSLNNMFMVGPEVKRTNASPSGKPPVLGPGDFNKRLHILGPGEDMAFPGSISQGASGADGWDIRPGESYVTVGVYESPQWRAPPVLPFWNGAVESNWVDFSVLP